MIQSPDKSSISNGNTTFSRGDPSPGNLVEGLVEHSSIVLGFKEVGDCDRKGWEVHCSCSIRVHLGHQ